MSAATREAVEAAGGALRNQWKAPQGKVAQVVAALLEGMGSELLRTRYEHTLKVELTERDMANAFHNSATATFNWSWNE